MKATIFSPRFCVGVWGRLSELLELEGALFLLELIIVPIWLTDVTSNLRHVRSRGRVTVNEQKRFVRLGWETAESHVEPSKAHPESSLWADPPAPCPLHPQLQFQSSGPLSFPPHALHILSTTLAARASCSVHYRWENRSWRSFQRASDFTTLIRPMTKIIP